MGGLVGRTRAGSDLSWSPRIVGCRGSFSNRSVDATTDALAVELRVAKVWDLRRLSLDLGVAAAGELLHERFATLGTAPSRTSVAGRVDVGLGLALPLTGAVYLTGELAAQAHVFTVESQAGVRSAVARIAARMVLAVGVWL